MRRLTRQASVRAAGESPTAEFTAAMAAAGPFEPAPRIAAGVSGGADSMALALLANAWVRERGGDLLALVVDHGLRPESADEAAQTVYRLQALGVPARLLTIPGLSRGPALAERARAARLKALSGACREAGILHLLLGHHAGDQAETVLIRSLGGSGAAGMAAMVPLVETPQLRVLRPLLTVPPQALRTLLASAGVAWVEDPSNADTRALRPRLRLLRRDREGTGPATTALVAAAAAAGRQRANQQAAIAASLGEHVVFRPEGFAVLFRDSLPPAAFAAVLQAIGGAPFPPATNSLTALAASLKPATLAGVRLLPAGRLGPGVLVIREAAAMTPPVPAVPGAIWDGRFRLGSGAQLPVGATMGALGVEAARFRDRSPLPSAVLQTLPALRVREELFAVPHLLYPDCKTCAGIPVIFSPPKAAAGAPYVFGDA